MHPRHAIRFAEAYWDLCRKAIELAADELPDTWDQRRYEVVIPYPVTMRPGAHPPKPPLTVPFERHKDGWIHPDVDVFPGPFEADAQVLGALSDYVKK
jgi:hypothetical protein